MTESTRLGSGVYFSFGMGTVANAIFSTLPGLLLLTYLVRQLGVSPALAGMVVMLPRCWDVISDPLVGSLSDRTRSSAGPRRPWLLAGTLLLPPGFLLLFSGTPLSGDAAAMYVLGLYLFATTAFTVFQVPYVAMPAEMTEDYHERTTLTAWRIAMLGVGVLIAGGLAPAIIEQAGGGREGFALMGQWVALLIFIACASAWWGTRHVPVRAIQPVSMPWREQWRAAMENRNFFRLLAAYALQGLAVGCMLAGVDFFSAYHLGDSAHTSALFLCLITPSLLTMPLWSAVGRRFGKRAGFIACSVIFAIGALLIPAVTPLGVWPVYGLVALVGTAYAGTQMFPLAMLPDTISEDTARTGLQRAGAYTGLWTAGEKLGLGLGAGLFALVLSLSGFVEGENGELRSQAEQAITGILWGFSVLPGLLLLASVRLIQQYRDQHRV